MFEGERLTLSFASATAIGFKITTSDGTPYIVTYPDGSTQEFKSGLRLIKSFGASESGNLSFRLQPNARITRIEEMSGVFNFNLSAISHLKALEVFDVGFTQVSGELLSISELVNMTRLDLANTLVTGKTRHIQNMVLMEDLNLNSLDVSGPLSAFEDMVSTRILSLSQSDIAGDIVSLSGMNDLERVYIFTTDIGGDISAFENKTSLSILYASTTEIYGDISSLSSSVLLEELVAVNTLLTGNLSTVSSWPLIEILNFAGTAVYGAFTAIASLASATSIQMYSINFDQTDVDDALIALAAGVIANATIHIGGTNSAPSAASQTARTTLESRGNTLTLTA